MSTEAASATWSHVWTPVASAPGSPLVVPLDAQLDAYAVAQSTSTPAQSGPIGPPNKELTALLGGKGANLVVLRAEGLPVPAGFCVTTEAFRQFVASCRRTTALCGSLAAIDPEETERAQSLAAQVRVCLAAAAMPPAIEEAVVSAWRTLGTTRNYAVRSSATVEDQPDASFAGQGDTFLNVSGRKAIVDKIRACWLSLFADRAVLYRLHNDIDPRTAAMAVVVQELVAAEVSGVLFTADPVTGSTERMVIEANYGLGMSLVDGRVSPDRLVLSRPKLEILRRETGRKTIEIVSDGDARVRQRNVDAVRAATACVDAALARRLGQMALEVERGLGRPQDLEWAAARGQIFLLQSRPITTLQKRDGTARPHQITWSNMNSWEILPDVVTPMSWSVVSFQLQSYFGRLLEVLGMDADRQPLFGLIAGRAYANLDTFADIVRALPGGERIDFTEWLGGQHGRRLAALIHRPKPDGWRNWLRRAIHWPRFVVWAVRHAVDQRSMKGLADFRRRMDRLADVNLAALSEAELIGHLAALLNLDRRLGPDMAASVAVATAFVRLFFRFVKRRLHEKDGAIANRMLGGLSGLASAEAGLDLWRLAVWTREQESLSAMVVEAADFAALRRQLAGTGEGRQFLGRWDQYMRRHGHHACGEMDIHNPRWKEIPDFILGLLQNHLTGKAGGNPRQYQQHLARQRTALARGFRQQLKNCFQREFFDFLFRKAQVGIVLRENARNECVRVLAAVRHTLLELGDRLCARGMLSQGEDIFFIELAELEPLIAGAKMGPRITARKAEFEKNRTIMPPPVVVGEFHPQPSEDRETAPSARVLRGLAASAGVARGPARVILDLRQGQRIEPGEILVAPHTDPGWTPYFLTAAGIVMDVGGMLSHGTIVAREYGIPAVVNVGSATRTIKTGQIIRVDGDRGIVTVEQ